MRGKLRVCQIIEATTGGAKRHVVDLATHLNADRFDTTVICSTLRDKSFQNDIAVMRNTGIEVAVIQMTRHISPLRDIASLIKILRFLKRGKFDVVHTHSSKAGFLGRLAATLAGVPRVVHTPHVFAFQMNVPRTFRYFYLVCERIAARFCHIIICVCENERQTAIADGLCNASKLVVVANGIEPLSPKQNELLEEQKTFSIEPNELVVSAVGRLAVQKGHHYLLLAAAHIVKNEKNVKFLIAGEGNQRKQLEETAKNLGIESHCLFPGGNTDTASLFHVSDLIVFPSLWEAVPYALLEAMSAGKAVIAFNVGGLSEVITPDSGVLVPPKDDRALALAISNLLADKPRRDRMGKAARDIVAQQYNLQNMINRTAAIYSG
ncbi:MAG: glycosyltransferase family 4 protein [Lentisphaerae bacterium]|nr:glycosyltransferase family 4 protein [Lentisphaerota bacterium]